MGRQRYTLADLKARLSERLGPNEKFWGSALEQKDALNEAISVWQALTGEWTTQIGMSGKGKNRNFYPVPRQIVSLTRVSLSDFVDPLETAEVFKAHILPNSEMEFRLDGTEIEGFCYQGDTVRWNVIPSGGMEPYTFQWSFSTGGVEQSNSTELEPVMHVPPPVTVPESPTYTPVEWLASCIVTDDTGQTYTATFPFEVETIVEDAASGGGILFVGTEMGLSGDGAPQWGYAAAPTIRYLLSNTITYLCGAGAKRVWFPWGPGNPDCVSYLEGLGHTVDQSAGVTLSRDNYDFAVPGYAPWINGWTWPNYAEYATVLQNFVEAGGGLFLQNFVDLTTGWSPYVNMISYLGANFPIDDLPEGETAGLVVADFTATNINMTTPYTSHEIFTNVSSNSVWGFYGRCVLNADGVTKGTQILSGTLSGASYPLFALWKRT